MDRSPTPSRLQFGPFVADFRACELRKDGRKTRLQEKPMRLLAALMASPGEVVSREELQKQLWPDDTFVDFETGLNVAVRKLREALADSPESPRYVETIPKRGYRFLAEVRKNSSNESSPVVEQPSPTAGLTSTSRRTIASLVETVLDYRRAGPVWVAVAVALALAVLAFIVMQMNVLNVPGLHERVFGASRTPAIHALAVLPLENLSGDPAQEYFSDRMTDALITDLAQIGSLKVISRTSSMQYKQTKKTLSEIARELNVDGIIEGTVQRSGDRVRITAQLIHGPSDKHIWAKSYERDMRDIFVLERDVTEDIVRQVQSRLSAPRQRSLTQPKPVDRKALELYLEGNSYVIGGERSMSDDEKRQAAEYFQQAIDIEPSFVPAYIGLANAHDNRRIGSSEDLALRRQAAEKVLALDPNSSDARCILAGLKLSNFEWTAAEEESRRAVEANPNNANAHDGFGMVLAGSGRLDDALRELEIAQTLDPTGDHLPLGLEIRGEYDQARAIILQRAKNSPQDGTIHYQLYRNYLASGKPKESIEEMEKALVLFGNSDIAADMRQGFAVSGYTGAMRQLAEDIEKLQANNLVFLPENLAIAYTAVGEKDRAFYWLDQAYEHREKVSHDFGLTILKVDPLLAPLHSDPRFAQLLRRIGLPP